MIICENMRVRERLLRYDAIWVCRGNSRNGLGREQTELRNAARAHRRAVAIFERCEIFVHARKYVERERDL